jgi:hypothetical protein
LRINPRERTLPDLVLTMEGEDLWRCDIRSGRESDVSSRPIFEYGGELCGLLITGTSEAEVRAGRGFGDNKCICEAGLGGMGVSSAPVRSMLILSIGVGLNQLQQNDECMREPHVLKKNCKIFETDTGPGRLSNY